MTRTTVARVLAIAAAVAGLGCLLAVVYLATGAIAVLAIVAALLLSAAASELG